MKITVLGVPSSVGAYCVGVERAPAELRDAGLIERLGIIDQATLCDNPRNAARDAHASADRTAVPRLVSALTSALASA